MAHKGALASVLERLPPKSEFTFTPIDEEIRPSDPGKQALAGLTDIATGIPAVAGLAGAGLETLARKFVLNTPEQEEPIGDIFSKSLSEGMDRSLLETGLAGRGTVNKFLEIGEPISTEDQAARLTASLIPIPGIRVASGAGKLAGNIANVLTPIVKLGETGSRFGKGFQARAGVQLGLGTTIDQTIRGLVDDPELPTMFSERAVSGVNPLISIAQAGEFTFTPVEEETIEVPVEFADRRELDIKVQKADDWETVKTFGIIVGVAAGSYAALKYSQHLAAKRIAGVAPFGASDPEAGKVSQFFTDLDPANVFTRGPRYLKEYPGILNQGRKDALEYVGEAFVDRSKALADALRESGHSVQTIDRVIANSHIDTAGMAQSVWETGKFSQGTNIFTHAGRKLEIDYSGLGENKRLFDEGMLAATTLTTRRADDVSASLWGARRSDDELRGMVVAARANPEVAKLMDQFSETFDAHLDYQVARKVLTKAEATAFRAKFTNTDGSLAYMPLYNVRQKSFFQRLGKAFGINTKKSREMDLIGEFHVRGAGDVQNPLGPMEALRQYTIHAIDHANTSAYHWQALGSLAGVQLRNGQLVRSIIDDDIVRRGGRKTTYIGSGQIDENADAVQISISNIAGRDAEKFKSGSVNDLRQQFPDEIITVQREGRLHAFHVPDPALRAALDLNPQLGAALQFFDHYKSLFTKFTTGNLSTFSPISFSFSAQQVASATAGREGVRAGLKSIPESFAGAYEIFVAKTSKEVADFLSQRLATNTGIGKTAPQSIERIRDVLERRFQTSLLNDVRGETGRISSSLQADTFTGSMADFADSFGRNFSDTFGADQMHLVWRLWKTWNNALHEGPAFGAMQKTLGRARIDGVEITPQLIRDSVDFSKSVAGDMKRLGASDMAKAFNATVPFSAAMVQSWNALGSAAVHNPKRFFAGVAVLIGVPTMAELTYTSLLSRMTNPDGSPLTFPDPNNPEKFWTYEDYYWNGYTTQQRADNFIFMIPGALPWDAMLFPVSPEWGLARGAIMEGADALFNFSQVGSISEADRESGKVSRDQFHSSLARVLDIPVPPPVAAAFASQGIDLRFGIAVEKTDDPDDPGQEISLLRGIPTGQGERVTRRSGRAKFAGSTLDTDTVAVLQDLFGSGASLYIATHEAFMTGKKLNNDSIIEGVKFGADAFAEGLQRQARWTQPLFGKTLRPNANDEIARELFNRRSNLERISIDATNYFTGALAGSRNQPNVGNAVVPPDDPINFELSGDAKNVLSSIKKLDEQVSNFRRQISIVGNSTTINGKKVSIKERDSFVDSLTLQIQALKAQQLAAIIDYEERATEALSQRYGREVNIDLSTFSPRTNLPTSSIFQELPK